MLFVGGIAAPTWADRPKHSPEHNAAVAHCGELYEAAARAAHAPKGPTGEERKKAMHAAA